MNKRVALITFVCCSVFATLIACSSSKNATVNSEKTSSEILVDIH